MIPLQGNESVVPEGWPLTLGRRGLVLQLGELEASALRLGECYLCIRSSAAVTTTSGSGEVAAGETDERNTVEVSHVCVVVPFSFLIRVIKQLAISAELCNYKSSSRVIGSSAINWILSR